MSQHKIIEMIHYFKAIQESCITLFISIIQLIQFLKAKISISKWIGQLNNVSFRIRTNNTYLRLKSSCCMGETY